MEIHNHASLVNVVCDISKYSNRIARLVSVKGPISICGNYVARVICDINSHDTRIRLSCACRALNGSPSLKRIVEVLTLWVLLRRSIFDTLGRVCVCVWTATNKWLKNATFTRGDGDSSFSFVKNYRDLVAVVTSGKWLRVTVNFIIS